MPDFQTVVMATCESTYGTFDVPGSKGKVWHVQLTGPEGPAFCDCPAFNFSKEANKGCKHIEQVMTEACLYNPQWFDGNADVKLKPVSCDYDRQLEEKCPNCKGPTVAVKYAL